jgi:hypothetical protein
MTNLNEIRRLKALAKRYARANRIALHQALDLVAGQLDFPHWNALISAGKISWLPSTEGLAKIEAFMGDTHPTFQIWEVDPDAMNLRFEDMEQEEEGKIGDYAYRLMNALDDVCMSGEGWNIRIPEAPNAVPIVEIAKHSSGSNPINDPEFLQEVLQIARARSQKIRARISTDWTRRSTKPDAEGKARHPLGRGLSNEWFCLHCNGVITGLQVAENLWHCPACGASPLDIFDNAFWLDENDEQPTPIDVPKVDQTKGPKVKIVDTKLKLELNQSNILLLIRSALIEDATNTNERLGALLAEITVDEDNDVEIAFDEDLWPADKYPVQALAVAELLGVELDQAIMWRTLPFAWPGLGEVTSSTLEYTRMLLDAYAQHGTDPGVD